MISRPPFSLIPALLVGLGLALGSCADSGMIATDAGATGGSGEGGSGSGGIGWEPFPAATQSDAMLGHRCVPPLALHRCGTCPR